MKEAIQKAIEGGWGDFYKGLPEGMIVECNDDGIAWRREIPLPEGVDGVTYSLRKDWDNLNFCEVREDPLFWQALGKSLEWKKYVWTSYKSFSDFNLKEETNDEDWIPKSEYAERHIAYVYHWHRFIDHLAEGKDADSFFKDLLTIK